MDFGAAAEAEDAGELFAELPEGFADGGETGLGLIMGLDVDFVGFGCVPTDLLLALLSSFFFISGFLTLSFFPGTGAFSLLPLLRDSRQLLVSLFTSCSSTPWMRLCLLASSGPRPP